MESVYLENGDYISFDPEDVLQDWWRWVRGLERRRVRGVDIGVEDFRTITRCVKEYDVTWDKAMRIVSLWRKLAGGSRFPLRSKGFVLCGFLCGFGRVVIRNGNDFEVCVGNVCERTPDLSSLAWELGVYREFRELLEDGIRRFFLSRLPPVENPRVFGASVKICRALKLNLVATYLSALYLHDRVVRGTASFRKIAEAFDFPSSLVKCAVRRLRREVDEERLIELLRSPLVNDVIRMSFDEIRGLLKK